MPRTSPNRTPPPGGDDFFELLDRALDEAADGAAEGLQGIRRAARQAVASVALRAALRVAGPLTDWLGDAAHELRRGRGRKP